MRITRLQIMLPYFNDIYEVGEPIQFCNQTLDSNMQAKFASRYGAIKRIDESPRIGTKTNYEIEFESGYHVSIFDTPVQIFLEEVAE